MKARTSDRGSYKEDDRTVPLVWILQGHRAGDNLQLQALAEGLGWPWISKKLDWHQKLPRWTPRYGRVAHLNHLTPASRATMKEPWPDLVLSIGWRSVPVARWIKAQCHARLVHLGRPRAPLSLFDLVITTPQYRLPDSPNVVQLTGPLTAFSPDATATLVAKWEKQLAHLTRPWTAVLVGGDTPSLRFPAAAAEALAVACNEHAARDQGSLLVATSPRTSTEVTDILRRSIKAPSFVSDWQKDTENPYAAFLALADQFIVTNDSISMTQEAAQTGKPVQVFPLTPKDRWQDRMARGLDGKLSRGDSALSKAYQQLIRQGVIYPPKTPAAYFDQLLQTGRVMTLGAPPPLGQNSPVVPETERAAAEVQKLFENLDTPKTNVP